jgi:hypothetical protein
MEVFCMEYEGGAVSRPTVILLEPNAFRAGMFSEDLSVGWKLDHCLEHQQISRWYYDAARDLHHGGGV